MARHNFGFTARKRLRLYRVEEILRDTRVIDPVPSRRTLIRKIEEGILEGYRHGYAYYVYEDSFNAWIRAHDPEGFEPVPHQPAAP